MGIGKSQVTNVIRTAEITNVDLLATGGTVIVPAVPVPTTKLLNVVARQYVIVEVTALTGTVTGQPTITLGTNSATFNNWAGTAVGTVGLTAVGAISQPTFSGSFAIVDITSLPLKFMVTTVATGTGLTNLKATVRIQYLTTS